MPNEILPTVVWSLSPRKSGQVADSSSTLKPSISYNSPLIRLGLVVDSGMEGLGICEDRPRYRQATVRSRITVNRFGKIALATTGGIRIAAPIEDERIHAKVPKSTRAQRRFARTYLDRAKVAHYCFALIMLMGTVGLLAGSLVKVLAAQM